MVKNFSVRREMFEDTEHEALHFDLTLDDKEYQGYYKDDAISWFQMQPDQEKHDMKLADLETEVKRRIVEWKKQ